MDKNDRLLKALDLLYGAILDDASFVKGFRTITELTGAQGVGHIEYDSQTGHANRVDTVDMDMETQLLYQRDYSSLDVRVPPALPIPIGRPFTENTVIDPKAFRSSEIYDFLLKHDITHILAAWTKKGPHSAAVFSLQRAHRQGAFSDEERQLLVPLVPHLIRALNIRNLLQDARARQQGYMEIVHRLPFGTFFLDSDRRVIEMSAVGQQLVRTGHGLRYRSGRLYAANPDDDRVLQRALNEAATGRSLQSGGSVRLRRATSHLPLTATVIPVNSFSLFAGAVPRCMLLVFDPHRSNAPSRRIVKEALRLTAAEAALACELFSGVSLRQAAQRLQLSVNTCKTQLKSIYAKTGCRSHVDLARALLLTGLTENLINEP
jgi:DNA-binding CsgD family transcriptional regulator